MARQYGRGFLLPASRLLFLLQRLCSRSPAECGHYLLRCWCEEIAGVPDLELPWRRVGQPGFSAMLQPVFFFQRPTPPKYRQMASLVRFDFPDYRICGFSVVLLWLDSFSLSFIHNPHNADRKSYAQYFAN